MTTNNFFQPQKLDIDEQIFDRNLKIIDDGEEKIAALGGPPRSKPDVRSLLPEPSYPSIQVTPEPGLCVKTKNVKGAKVFINLCKIQEIPPAPPLTEDQLLEIISKEDYTSTYRVPMSLGSPRPEKDKGGAECLACDVAINSAWFEDTMEESVAFTTFVINLAMEGLCDKYGDDVNLDRQNWNILKNKKYLGTRQRHHIQQRQKKIHEVGDPTDTAIPEKKKPLISEIGAGSEVSKTKSLVHPPGVVVRPHSLCTEGKTPEFKLMKEPINTALPQFIVAEIKLPGVKSHRELTLDIGEDRLVLEARKVGYLMDIFLPYNLATDLCCAQYHRDMEALTVTMPIANEH